jgi:hypothetical protein
MPESPWPRRAATIVFALEAPALFPRQTQIRVLVVDMDTRREACFRSPPKSRYSCSTHRGGRRSVCIDAAKFLCGLAHSGLSNPRRRSLLSASGETLRHYVQSGVADYCEVHIEPVFHTANSRDFRAVFVETGHNFSDGACLLTILMRTKLTAVILS